MSRPGPLPTTVVLGVSAKFASVCREAASRAGTTYIGVSLADAPSVVVRERPAVLLLTEDVYSFDPERFDALADGVGAELTIAGSEDEAMTRVARRILRAVLTASQRRRNTEARPTIPAPATPLPTARVQVRREWPDDEVTPLSRGPAVTAPPTAEAAMLEASFTTGELRAATPQMDVDLDDLELEVRPSEATSGTPPVSPIGAPVSSDSTLRPVTACANRRPRSHRPVHARHRRPQALTSRRVRGRRPARATLRPDSGRC